MKTPQVDVLKERRCVLLHVDTQAILAVLQNACGHETIQLPRWKEIPPDAVATSVKYVPFDDCFYIRIYHPSFAPTAEGARFPVVEPEQGKPVSIPRELCVTPVTIDRSKRHPGFESGEVDYDPYKE